jgi:hypothetical protein
VYNGKRQIKKEQQEKLLTVGSAFKLAKTISCLIQTAL